MFKHLIMKKRQVNLKKLSLEKQVISSLSRKQILGGDPFSRYSCGDAGCIPPIDVTLNKGCQFDTVGCPQLSERETDCYCDSIVTCKVC